MPGRGATVISLTPEGRTKARPLRWRPQRFRPPQAQGRQQAIRKHGSSRCYLLGSLLSTVHQSDVDLGEDRESRQNNQDDPSHHEAKLLVPVPAVSTSVQLGMGISLAPAEVCLSRYTFMRSSWAMSPRIWF